MLTCNSEITGLMVNDANKSYMLTDVYESTAIHKCERKIQINKFSIYCRNLIGNNHN